MPIELDTVEPSTENVPPTDSLAKHRCSTAVVICTLGNPLLLECLESLAAQTRRPDLVCIVNGSPRAEWETAAQERLRAAGIPIRIAHCSPGLVAQRNLLLPELTADVVYYIDDDATLQPTYLERTVTVYEEDAGGQIGGVQGVLAEQAYVVPRTLARVFRRVFLLTETEGHGVLKSSGFPSFSSSVSAPRNVEVMLGCAMSFRRHALGDGFDRRLERRWWGDDFTMAYRVAQRYRLVQIPDAVFFHKPHHTRPDKEYDAMQMQVINRWYVYREYLGGRPLFLPAFLWASLGELLQSLAYLARRRTGLLRGFVAGWWQLANGSR